MVVDERKYKRKVLLISIISLAVYALFFSALIIVGDIVLGSIIISKADTEIDAALKGTIDKAPIDIFEAQQKYPDVSIAYFDSTGSLILTKGNYYDVYNKLGDLGYVNKTITSALDGMRYRTATYEMLHEGNAVKVKVFFALEPLYKIKKMVMLYITVAFALVLLIVLLVSFLISNRIAKPYMELAKKNNQLIYDTAHELNTPLAVISTQVSNVTNSPMLDDKLCEELDIAKDELSRMRRMIKEMLTLAKVENDMLPLNIKKVDINHIINEITEPYAILSESQDKKFNLICNCDSFNTDEDKLKQILHIVLDNALKYTEPGESITLMVRKELDKLKLTVADTGLGVPDDDLEKIFNKFYRVDASRTKSTGGNGIGLALLKAIIFKMGGKLLASHNNPKGLKLEMVLVEKPLKNLNVNTEGQ